jgi:hypothetical protein
VNPQPPSTQRAVAFTGAAHARLQAPQWAVLDARLAQEPPQFISPAAHTVPQRPAEHTWAPAQAARHAPQFARSLVVLTSQPLAAIPSQSAKPALQVNPQAPAAQVAVALAGAEHALPQRPQCVVLARVSTSQPLVAMPSQLSKPALQVSPHVPAAHAGEALAPVGQRVPQAPQLLVSVGSGASQPVAGIPSQSAVRIGSVHRRRQRPASQRASLPGPEAQRLPQAPQWLTSDCVSTQAPPQVVKGHSSVVQAKAPSTAAQRGVGAAQRRPHIPQLSALDRSVSQPLAGFMSQSAKPRSQVAPQRPAAQVATPRAGAGQTVPQAPQFITSVWALTHDMPQRTSPGAAQEVPHAPPEHTIPSGHERPHAPQLVRSVMRGASQPLTGTASQLPKAALHVTVQLPLSQRGAPLLVAGHARLQPPQWGTAVRRSVSQPLAATPSQSPRWAAQWVTQRPLSQVELGLTTWQS